MGSNDAASTAGRARETGQTAEAADEVIAVTPIDQLTPYPNIFICNYFVVDDRLDEAVLRDALDRLIRHHWRKLGARLVQRADGRFEYRLPRAFADGYELFRWSSAEHEHALDLHLPLRRPPPAGDGVAVVGDMEDVHAALRPAHWPKDWTPERGAGPIVYAHLARFADATVVATGISHTVADQLGSGNIVRAWLGLVEGRAPPPMVGYDADIIPGKTPYAQFTREQRTRPGRIRAMNYLELFIMVLGLVWEMVLHRKESSSIFVFPRPVVKALRERLQTEIDEKHGGGVTISEGDALSAVLTKLGRMHDAKPRDLVLSQVVNVRGRIPELAPGEASDGYIHNGLHYAPAQFRLTPSTPASEIARRSRTAIERAKRAEEIEFGMAALRETARRGLITTGFLPFTRLHGVFSWCSAWRGIDFSPALTAEAVARRAGRPLKMLILGRAKRELHPGRYCNYIMSRNEDGYYCDVRLPTETARLVREYLKSDPLLERV